MMCALYTLQYAKDTCPAETMLNSETIKPIAFYYYQVYQLGTDALSIIKLHLSEGSQTGSHIPWHNFLNVAIYWKYIIVAWLYLTKFQVGIVK